MILDIKYTSIKRMAVQSPKLPYNTRVLKGHILLENVEDAGVRQNGSIVSFAHKYKAFLP